IGMDDFQSPGFGFILGQQDHGLNGDIVRDFARSAATNDWLVRTPSIFTAHTNARTETINARLSVEPFRGMRVEFNANRTSALNRQSFFRWSETAQDYVNDSPNETGSFSVTMITWRTAFVNDNSD